MTHTHSLVGHGQLIKDREMSVPGPLQQRGMQREDPPACFPGCPAQIKLNMSPSIISASNSQPDAQARKDQNFWESYSNRIQVMCTLMT